MSRIVKNLLAGKDVRKVLKESLDLGDPDDYTTTELFNIFHDEYKDIIPGDWSQVFRDITGISKKVTDACYKKDISIPNDPKANEKLIDYLEELEMDIDEAGAVDIEFVKQVEDIVESVGWYVTGSDPGSTDWTFRVGNPDFECDFTIYVEASNAEELIREVSDYVDDFDISRETYYWLDSSGHGQNGAPYDMRDCYEDIERFYKQAEILAETLKKKLK